MLCTNREFFHTLRNRYYTHTQVHFVIVKRVTVKAFDVHESCCSIGFRVVDGRHLWLWLVVTNMDFAERACLGVHCSILSKTTAKRGRILAVGSTCFVGLLTLEGHSFLRNLESLGEVLHSSC